jgi:sugar lactone lactonase YvrE
MKRGLLASHGLGIPFALRHGMTQRATFASLVFPSLALVLPMDRATAQAPAIQYAYDELGRLVAATSKGRLTWPRSASRRGAERGLVLALTLLIPSTLGPPLNVTALGPLEIWADGFGLVGSVAADSVGHLYVTDTDAGTVTCVAPDRSRTVVARGLDQPLGIALDAGGRLLIAEEGAGRVVRVEPGGGRIAVATGLRRPRWLAVSEGGIVFISARRGGSGNAMAVLALHPNGRLVVFADDFKNLEGLAVGDDRLFMAAKGRGGADHEGAIFQMVIRPDGSPGPLTSLGPDDRLKSPLGLARDRLGALYVTVKELASGSSKAKDAVAKVHDDGAITGFASDLRDPQGLALDRDGHLYVADGRGGRVVRFRAPPAPTLDGLPDFTKQPAAIVRGTTAAGARLVLVPEDSVAPVTGTADPAGKFFGRGPAGHERLELHRGHRHRAGRPRSRLPCRRGHHRP